MNFYLGPGRFSMTKRDFPSVFCRTTFVRDLKEATHLIIPDGHKPPLDLLTRHPHLNRHILTETQFRLLKFQQCKKAEADLEKVIPPRYRSQLENGVEITQTQVPEILGGSQSVDALQVSTIINSHGRLPELELFQLYQLQERVQQEIQVLERWSIQAVENKQSQWTFLKLKFINDENYQPFLILLGQYRYWLQQQTPIYEKEFQSKANTEIKALNSINENTLKEKTVGPFLQNLWLLYCHPEIKFEGQADNDQDIVKIRQLLELNTPHRLCLELLTEINRISSNFMDKKLPEILNNLKDDQKTSLKDFLQNNAKIDFKHIPAEEKPSVQILGLIYLLAKKFTVIDSWSDIFWNWIGDLRKGFQAAADAS